MLRLSLVLLLAAAAALASSADRVLLAPRYDHSILGAPTFPSDSSAAPGGDAKRYARLVALHAVLGFLAFQVVAPLAVVIAAVGKSWGSLWFKAHWRLQLYVVAPATALSVLMGALAASGEGLVGHVELKHRITGYVLLGALAVQTLVGYYSHHRQVVVERFAAENGRDLPEPKRRLSNWMHMALGIGLLTVGGLEVTWGFSQYEERVGEPVPTWVVVVHWIVAGLPVLIVTPFVLIRGILRLRRGASFTEAFFTPFHSSSSSLTARGSSSQQPPRKLFLNSATYLSAPVFDVDLENEKADGGVGHAYGRGPGAEGRMRVDSLASSTWVGAATREEYEAEVASSRGARTDSVVGSSAASFRSWTTIVGGDYPQAEGVPEDTAAKPSQAAAAARPPAASQPYDSAPVPATYPPPPVCVSDLVTTTPSLPPLPAIFSPVSSTPPAAAPAPAHPLSTASAIASPLSPRLSFMPFPGPVPAHPPPPPTVSSSPAPSALTASSGTHEAHDGASPAAASPVLVREPLEGRDRHGSFAGQIVDAPVVAKADRLLPLPGEPGSPSSVDTRRTGAVEHGHGTEEEDDDDGTSARDDAESTRLMDELERELTISSVRSGRSARPDAAAEEGAAGVQANEEKRQEQGEEKEVEDEQTQLEREQSGKWFGSNRLSSSS